MKILFLDFDGVLNTPEYIKSHGDSEAGIDRTRLALIKKLVDATDAKIVLITSLREYWDKDPSKCDYYGTVINRVFAEYGLEVFDKTPILDSGERVDEILEWIVNNPGVLNYVAIDDGDLRANFLTKNFVQPKDGLCEVDVEKAIEILNR